MADTVVNPQQGSNPKRVWIQLAQVGSFRGHGKGPFTLDPSVFSTMVRNFDHDGIPIPIDAEHASEMPANSGSIPVEGAPAMGWIHSLDNRGRGGLWGQVEWLEPARSYIKEGRYRYLSPAIKFKSRDRVTGQDTGPRLSSAAITNTPFLTSMAPLTARQDDGLEVVVLSRVDDDDATLLGAGAGTQCYSAHEYMPRIRSALRMSDLASATECSDQLSRLRDHLDAAGGDGTAAHEGITLADYLMPLRQLAQPALGATWEQVLDIIDDLLDAQIGGDDDDDEPAEAATAASASAAAPNTAPADAATMASQTDPQPAPPAPEPVSTPEEQQEPHTMTTPATPAQPTSIVAPAAPAGTPPAAPPADSNETMRLRLELKAAEHQVTLLSSENAELKAWQSDRIEADYATEASIAFDTYKDKKGLSDTDRPVLLSILRTNPEAFRTMYPPVAPSERHLLRTIAAAPRTGAPSAAAGRMPAPRVPADLPTSSEPVTMSLRDLSRQIAAKERIPVGAAQLKASRIIRAQRAQQSAR